MGSIMGVVCVFLFRVYRGCIYIRAYIRVINIIVHPLITVIREIITLNESVNISFNTCVCVCAWQLHCSDYSAPGMCTGNCHAIREVMFRSPVMRGYETMIVE